MRKSKYVEGLYEVDLGLTFLFWEVYGGNEFSPIQENATLSDFKTQFIKLITTIKQSFLDTCIDTDKSHKAEIIELVSAQLKQIKSKKSVEDLYITLVNFFPKLCFLLIGRRLSNSSKKLKDNRGDWTINQHRQIHYSQTREQKFELLRDSLKNKSIEGLGDYKTEIKNYQEQRLSGEDMLDWLKRLHSEKYFSLFDRTI